MDNQTNAEQGIKPAIPETRITVDYRPGRWGRVFHLFDLDGREIALHQKDALKLARSILKIANEKEQRP